MAERKQTELHVSIHQSYDLTNYPPSPEFNWRRALFRTSMMVLNVLIGETVPSFGKILNLIGGSTLTLMTFILPPVLYLRLTHMTSNEGKWEKT